MVINGSNATLILNQPYTFNDVTVTSGFITSAAYSNAISGSAWSTAPAPGNGQLVMTVLGTLTLNSGGVIDMNTKGYAGGNSSTRTQGGSLAGPGTTATAANGGGGGGSASSSFTAGGGSYGTAGGDSTSLSNSAPVAGATFGALDFDNQLYLGSGGGGNSGFGATGGAGGGAIKLTVGNLSMASGSSIRAAGGAPGNTNMAGGGSGGTIVIDISGTYTNSGGTITVAGGGTTNSFGGSGRIKFPQAKLIDASNNLSVSGFSLYDIHLTSNINNFNVGANTTVNLTAAKDVTVSSLAINGSNAELRLNDQWTRLEPSADPLGKSFGSVTVTNGVLTSNGYSNTVSSGAWATTPAAGNGQLIMEVTGNLTVQSSGKIHMDAKGFTGGTVSRPQGGSPTGPGANLTAANGGGGGAGTTSSTYGAGGSYGTAGMDRSAESTSFGVAGTTYGETNFHEQLYLGSGGGGGNFSSSPARGGSGGGAIKLVIGGNLSIASSGQISAQGGTPSGAFGGAGSGGTIVIDLTGTFSNSGAITVAGGSYTSTSGGSGRIKFPLAKLIDASNNLSIAGFSLLDINLPSNVNTFTVNANATINLTAANNVSVSSLVINGTNAEVRLNDQWTQSTFGKSFGSITVTNGVLTSNAYSNTISSGAWATTPAAGNGQLIADVTGTLTVGASGRIHMDAKGFMGGTAARTQGGSPTGPGTSSTAANGGGGGGTSTNTAMAGGGSYGTAGVAGTGSAGTTYGASDFTTALWLGAGGGANSNNGRPGSYGGGAIKLSVGNLTVQSGGQITAKGGSPTVAFAGGGAGGSVVISATGTFTNNGTISVAGGTSPWSVHGGNGRSQTP